MINKYLAMGLGALIAVAPVAAMAETSMPKTHMSSHKMHKTHKMSSKSHKKMSKKMTAPMAPKS